MKEISDQEIQQAFYDLAAKLEAELGDWESEPDNPELKERILKSVQERLEQE